MRVRDEFGGPRTHNQLSRNLSGTLNEGSSKLINSHSIPFRRAD